MLIRSGRCLVIALSDGATVKGISKWCWSRRWLRISGASIDDVTADGMLLVPTSRVELVQILGKVKKGDN